MQRVNCAIYVRKSSEKGLDMEFNSLQNQEEACKNYILSQAFNRWEYFKTYTDGGISGGTMKRPALVEMIDDMKKGLIQTVVCYKVDRLSRSILDFHNMMKEFDKYNCSFVSITQAFDTSTSMGKLTLNMLLSFAQFEREVSSERIHDKLVASKTKGIWTGGPQPLGYDVIDKKLVVNEKEAKVVRFIFEKYVELQSLRLLADFLKCAGIKNKAWTSRGGKVKGGKHFNADRLHTLLHRKIFIGEIEYKNGKKSYPGQHEAIIDRELFNEAQDILNDNKNNQTGAYRRDGYLLTNKIFDSDGRQFKNQMSVKNSVQKFRYYFLKKLYLPAGDIDEITIALIKDLFENVPGSASQQAGTTSGCNQNNEHADNTPLFDDAQKMEFCQVDFDVLTPAEKRSLIRMLIDKIIYQEGSLTYFINIGDLTFMKAFRKPNFLRPIKDANAERRDYKIHRSGDGGHLVIEKEFTINPRPSSNIYIGKGKKFIDRTENNNNLIKALAVGWRYGKMLADGWTIRKIMETEQKCSRTIYKYLNLNYLSPNIVNNIMSGDAAGGVNLQRLFGIAEGGGDFGGQEKEYFGK